MFTGEGLHVPGIAGLLVDCDGSVMGVEPWHNGATGSKVGIRANISSSAR